MVGGSIFLFPSSTPVGLPEAGFWCFRSWKGFLFSKGGRNPGVERDSGSCDSLWRGSFLEVEQATTTALPCGSSPGQTRLTITPCPQRFRPRCEVSRSLSHPISARCVRAAWSLLLLTPKTAAIQVEVQH